MSDSEDDDLDAMWDELGDDEDTNVSSNLADVLGEGRAVTTVHAGDADEGRVTWEPPAYHGLTNSHEVTMATKHWYREDEAEESPAAAAAPATPAAFAAPAAPAALAAPAAFPTPAAPGAPAVPATPGLGMLQFNPDGSIKW
mmetsp:Transcript_25316/g.57675  ORF Transcript_25316/g.57675 Transcript_25316/m.57675 type:complete len:142 (-) Transcript_25316:589-1014(-)